LPALEGDRYLITPLDPNPRLGKRGLLCRLEQRFGVASPFSCTIKLTGLTTCAAIKVNRDDSHKELLWILSGKVSSRRYTRALMFMKNF
jgi:hypothetical protein